MFENVTIDIRKLRDYCLNPNHPVGKHKARVFSAYLNLRKDEANLLKAEIIRKIKNTYIREEHEDDYGKRFSAEIEVHIKNKTALVKTVWIIKKDEKVPELVTCYVIT